MKTYSICVFDYKAFNYFILKWLLRIVLVFVGVQTTFAQQSQVDSIISLLEKSKTQMGLDTERFVNAAELITTIQLTDEQVNRLETAGNKFNKGTDEDISYFVKYNILQSLGKSDLNKAIEYGKLNYEKLDKSTTPHASLLKIEFLRELRHPFRNSTRFTEGFQYFSEKLNDLKFKNDSLGLSVCYSNIGSIYAIRGLFDEAIYNGKKSTSYIVTVDSGKKFFSFKSRTGKTAWIDRYFNTGNIYLQKGDYAQSLIHSEIAYNYFRKNLPNQFNYYFPAGLIAKVKILTNKLDSVPYFLKIAMDGAEKKEDFETLAQILQIQALYKIKTGDLNAADSALDQSWQLINEHKLPVTTRALDLDPDYYRALVRIQQNRYNDAIDLLIKDMSRMKNVRYEVLRDYKLLAEVYEKAGNNYKAKQTYKDFIALQDSIHADENQFRTLSFETEQQINEKELSITKLQNESKVSTLVRNFTLGIVALLSILAGVMYYRYKTKQKDNAILEKTLTELKSTQNQLVQKEKLASLGELTAGIAHEIQNPLNFVNNFSELSMDLVRDVNEEIEKDTIDKDYVKDLMSDLTSNQQKINHHGKRASSIVKGMLEHSRASTGKREMTDINRLADEYLRLSYHGLRAKDKTFNSDYKTDFDESLPKINVVPQDIGRVILNLINNAFYAVNEKNKTVSDKNYVPLVTVSTKRIGDTIEIKVKDNGNGIPDKIKEKIFQPFFTTKPTGEGTGLGLSLAYDIITKGHGGELKVESVEGIGSEFILKLNLNF